MRGESRQQRVKEGQSGREREGEGRKAATFRLDWLEILGLLDLGLFFANYLLSA